MSRAEYSDDGCGEWQWIMWRGAVHSALQGKRGQAFLREMVEALDEIPDKRLIVGDLVIVDGLLTTTNGCCAIGAVALKRGVDVAGRRLNFASNDELAKVFGIANAMVREIEFINDEGTWRTETDEDRWVRVRGWVEEQIA